jgi:hypothetical protein
MFRENEALNLQKSENCHGTCLRNNRTLRRMPYSVMLRRVALVSSHVSEKHNTFINPHSVTALKTAFFKFTAAETSNNIQYIPQITGHVGHVTAHVLATVRPAVCRWCWRRKGVCLSNNEINIIVDIKFRRTLPSGKLSRRYQSKTPFGTLQRLALFRTDDSEKVMSPSSAAFWTVRNWYVGSK